MRQLTYFVKLADFAELIKRLHALTLRLLPLEVDVKTIHDPTNRIITPLVMLSYMEAAGDFGDAVSPFVTPELANEHASCILSFLTPFYEHIQDSSGKLDATLPIMVKTSVAVRVSNLHNGD